MAAVPNYLLILASQYLATRRDIAAPRNKNLKFFVRLEND